MASTARIDPALLSPNDTFVFEFDYDAPPMRPEQREVCIQWLRSIHFLEPGGRNEINWRVIKEKWIQFSQERSKSVHLRRWQEMFWPWIDGLEGLSERWPAAARTLLNQCADGPDAKAFESFGARWHVEPRRRLHTVWSGLFMFLLYNHPWGGTRELFDMGLYAPIDEDCEVSSQDSLILPGDDSKLSWELGDLWMSLISRYPRAHVMADTHSLVIDALKGVRETKADNNALLWWTAILVRSAVSVSDGNGDDWISHGKCPFGNLLAPDLDLLKRVEAIRHYCKVMVLDHAMYTWAPRNVIHGLCKVETQLNSQDTSWMNGIDGIRPDEQQDQINTDSAAWEDVLSHLNQVGGRLLGGKKGTAMYEINRLYRGLRDCVREDTEKTAGEGAQGHVLDKVKEEHKEESNQRKESK
ncbi:hypothetical protein PFICI_10930 [Pestalotiopsis fici W106-1]|uniref:Uncharacterized protein n=1 Tax=Pestalotiopsis fici (strain W106-1 / CGMCC3.15140) TaxID=1229662 RepID=W3WW24_PESFW|nr:uncharacterized protein PFICI_10930 [Pestalotiopsis fici W106-1]ETS77056.1 hypothetical protein PFICI_10930 [Pestalotiopsis fici W106-1]